MISKDFDRLKELVDTCDLIKRIPQLIGFRLLNEQLNKEITHLSSKIIEDIYKV